MNVHTHDYLWKVDDHAHEQRHSVRVGDHGLAPVVGGQVVQQLQCPSVDVQGVTGSIVRGDEVVISR